jgi:hypothetical protein
LIEVFSMPICNIYFNDAIPGPRVATEPHREKGRGSRVAVLTLRSALYIPFGLATLGLIQAAMLVVSSIVEGSVIVIILKMLLLSFALASTLIPLAAVALYATRKICPAPKRGMAVFVAAYCASQVLVLINLTSFVPGVQINLSLVTGWLASWMVAGYAFYITRPGSNSRPSQMASSSGRA